MTVLAFHNSERRIIAGMNNFHPDRFSRLIVALRSHGYTFSNVDDYIDTNDRGKLICLTFDDGFEAFYKNILPILEKLQVPATVFIPADFIGKTDSWDYSSRLMQSKHLDRTMIKELADSGITIGSHGANHEALTEMGERRLGIQLKRSKEILQEITGKRADYISYPFGRFNAAIEKACLDAGYLKGFSMSGYDKSAYGFTIPRMAVYAFDTPWSVIRKTKNGFPGTLEKIKGMIMNRYAGGTILLNRIRSLSGKRA